MKDNDGSNLELRLEGAIISLEFAPLTKSIRVCNIPQGTTSDSVRFKFSNKRFGGGKVTSMILDKKNGVADICFEKSSGI